MLLDKISNIMADGRYGVALLQNPYSLDAWGFKGRSVSGIPLRWVDQQSSSIGGNSALGNNSSGAIEALM